MPKVVPVLNRTIRHLRLPTGLPTIASAPIPDGEDKEGAPRAQGVERQEWVDLVAGVKLTRGVEPSRMLIEEEIWKECLKQDFTRRCLDSGSVQALKVETVSVEELKAAKAKQELLRKGPSKRRLMQQRASR